MIARARRRGPRAAQFAGWQQMVSSLATVAVPVAVGGVATPQPFVGVISNSFAVNARFAYGAHAPLIVTRRSGVPWQLGPAKRRTEPPQACGAHAHAVQVRPSVICEPAKY